MIRYGWHPWVGKLVQLVQLIQRGSEPSLRVECVIGRRVRRVDIPCWMFDLIAQMFLQQLRENGSKSNRKEVVHARED